jgi:hypothetical protein
MKRKGGKNNRTEKCWKRENLTKIGFFAVLGVKSKYRT